MLLGAHESINGGYYKAILRGKEDGCDCIQIFTKSPRMWKKKIVTDKEAEQFKKTAKENNIIKNVSHASYLLNITHADKNMRNKSINSLINELECAEKLGLIGVVFHPGSNKDEKNRYKIVSESINIILSKTKGFKTKLIIENMAGQGSNVGATFEEIKNIIKGIKEKSRVRVCLDTCHTFVAGYDIRNKKSLNNTLKQFDKLIGLQNLICFHFNDSKKELGSKIDRHENIGQGKIGTECFRLLVNDKRFKTTPAYLETPLLSNGKSSFTYNLKKLRKLIK